MRNLWADIRGDADSIPDKGPGDQVVKTDWERLKTKSDDLVEYNDSGDYSNAVSYNDRAHTNHANYVL